MTRNQVKNDKTKKNEPGNERNNRKIKTREKLRGFPKYGFRAPPLTSELYEQLQHPSSMIYLTCPAMPCLPRGCRYSRQHRNNSTPPFTLLPLTLTLTTLIPPSSNTLSGPSHPHSPPPLPPPHLSFPTFILYTLIYLTNFTDAIKDTLTGEISSMSIYSPESYRRPISSTCI